MNNLKEHKKLDINSLREQQKLLLDKLKKFTICKVLYWDHNNNSVPEPLSLTLKSLKDKIKFY